MQKGQSETNTNSAMAGGANMHVAQKLRSDLGKAGFTNITIMPSSFIVRAKNSEGAPVMMVISPDSVTALTEETPSLELRQQLEAHGRKQQQRRSDARTEFDRGFPTHHARRRQQAVIAVEAAKSVKGPIPMGP